MSSITPTNLTNDVKPTTQTPFTSAVLGEGDDFWRSYVAARPSPSEDFFRLISTYHRSYGGYRCDVAHDVGTGPGNIAERLAKYYEHVIGSDVNDQALAVAPALIDAETLKRMTVVHAPAEELADDGIVPLEFGKGKTDLVVVSECMPLLDQAKALHAFSELLRPDGTLAIYFYGRPLFADGNRDECDEIYERIATKIFTFSLPINGTPGLLFYQRSYGMLESWLDDVELSPETWHHVEPT